MAAKFKGFTLIEMIIVIVVMAIAITGISVSLFPQGRQSAEQVAAVKASELGRAVMDEIMGRNFDQNSGPYGGLPECNPAINGCTPPGAFGTDGEANKSEFNDVDDFHGLSGDATDVLGGTLSEGYAGYQIDVEVVYDQEVSGVMQRANPGVQTHYKRVNVTVTDRQGNQYPFAAIRGNF